MDLDALTERAQKAVAAALHHGATQADVVSAYGSRLRVAVNGGAIDSLTQAVSKQLGLRVFVGGRVALCSTQDFSDEALDMVAKRAVELAQESDEDPANGLSSDATGTEEDDQTLELYDPDVKRLTVEEAIEWSHRIERAAREAEPQVRKFRDSGVSSGEARAVLANSLGGIRRSQSSGVSAWCSAIAGEGADMQTSSWSDSKCFVSNLDSPEHVGRTAAHRAARMLGAKPIETQEIPVVFEPRMAAQFLGGLRSAIVGDLVRRNMSFLGSSLGKEIAVPGLTILDDPHLPGGSASTQSDGDGLRTAPKHIVKNGVLQSFIYDTYTARKSDTQSTRNARRGITGSPYPGVFNYRVEPGEGTLDDLVASVDRGLLLTRWMGGGANAVTGRISTGAAGLWIEGGQVRFPVQEITLAGDMLDMLKNIDAIGADLYRSGSTECPSLRISKVMVSGS